MENFTNKGIEINQRKNSFWLILQGYLKCLQKDN